MAVKIPKKKPRRVASEQELKNRMTIMQDTLNMVQTLIQNGAQPEEAVAYITALKEAIEHVGPAGHLTYQQWHDLVLKSQPTWVWVNTPRIEYLEDCIRQAIKRLSGDRICYHCHAVEDEGCEPDCPVGLLRRALQPRYPEAGKPDPRHNFGGRKSASRKPGGSNSEKRS